METLVRKIQQSGYQGVLAITGGGAVGVSEVMRYGGSSSTILEVIMPYAFTAFEDFIQAKPGSGPVKTCSEDAARTLALQAYQRARKLASKDAKKLFGLGLTCSLIRHENERPGRVHSLFVAYQTESEAAVYNVVVPASNRVGQETFTGNVLLFLLMRAVGTSPEAAINELKDKDSWDNDMHNDMLRDCLKSLVPSAYVEDSYYNALLTNEAYFLQYNIPGSDLPRLIVPGSFNPLHDGHRKMAQIAEALTGHPATFDLSITNVDKPALDMLEVAKRKSQFLKEGLQLVLTNEPTLVRKAALFPGCTFAVGIDTWTRFVDPKYHQGSYSKIVEAIRFMSTNKNHVLVFGRKVGDEFLTWKPLPSGIDSSLVTAISEQQFREDVSSTELRTRKS